MNKAQIRKIYDTTKNILFPICLLLFACIRANRGIDLTDTTYSLGNYEFFSESTGVWFLLTFFSNVVGKLIMLLPFGTMMLGFKIYSSLIIGGFAVFGYRFFRTKMPAWLAFLAELAALGLCWCPTAILYHYLSYGFLLFGAVFLFRGLASSRKHCLFIAGILLGISTFVRFPNNGLQVLLVLPLIFYGVITGKETKEIFKQIGLCVGGYLLSFGIILISMMFIYGPSVPSMLVEGVTGISNSASDYTFSSMLFSIVNAYWHGFKWALYLIICGLMGVPFFMLFGSKYLKARKIVYILCTAFLMVVLLKFGMFNFKYYQKEAALQWGAIFTLVSIVINIYMVCSKRFNTDWRLIGFISLVIIIITPLGSNNYIWPVLNNMFFVAPITFWMIYKYVRWGRVFLDRTGKINQFPFKTMLFATLCMFFIQSVGIGTSYVFVQGENGESVSCKVEGNERLKGMKTTAENAENLSGLSKYMNDNEEKYSNRKLILYGDIPGIAYILNKPSALNTTWSDLDSNPVEDMQEALIEIDAKDTSNRPLVITSNDVIYHPDNSIKLNLIMNFINNNEYSIAYENNGFVVFE